jgi:hypothetical protein
LAKAQLQEDSKNPQTKEILSNSHGRLRKFFQDCKKIQPHLNYQLVRVLYGDKCSKLFFDFHKAGKKKVLIKEHVDGESTITR